LLACACAAGPVAGKRLNPTMVNMSANANIKRAGFKKTVRPGISASQPRVLHHPGIENSLDPTD